MIIYARALGAAHTGDFAGAQAEIGKLEAARDALTQAKNTYWASQVDVEARSASAVLAQAQGRKDEALTLMRSAADLEDASDKHPVTPGSIVPARELLGDMLLEANQPAEALAKLAQLGAQSFSRAGRCRGGRQTLFEFALAALNPIKEVDHCGALPRARCGVTLLVTQGAM
jgi:hypothetical protein